MRGLVCALLLFTGAVFLYDSSAYSLSPSDPSSGRAKGCYTLVDLAVGATMPTVWARPLEFLLGVTSVAMSVAILRKRSQTGAWNSRAVEQ